jgi:hypothetical protein
MCLLLPPPRSYCNTFTVPAKPTSNCLLAAYLEDRTPEYATLVLNDYTTDTTWKLEGLRALWHGLGLQGAAEFIAEAYWPDSQLRHQISYRCLVAVIRLALRRSIV